LMEGNGTAQRVLPTARTISSMGQCSGFGAVSRNGPVNSRSNARHNPSMGEGGEQDLERLRSQSDDEADECKRVGLRTTRMPPSDSYGGFLLSEPTETGERPRAFWRFPVSTPRISLRINPLRREGDKAFGPDVVDIKGGISLSIAAFAAVRSSNQTPLLARPLFVSEEEIGSPESRHVIMEQVACAKYVLVFEPL